jgi:hypothetical protein
MEVDATSFLFFPLSPSLVVSPFCLHLCIYLCTTDTTVPSLCLSVLYAVCHMPLRRIGLGLGYVRVRQAKGKGKQDRRRVTVTGKTDT